MRSISVLAIAFLLLTATIAQAASLESDLSRGYAHLRAGDTEEALNIFRTLLTDAPDSELVQYSIAAAQRQRALQLFDSGDAEKAGEIMAEAQDMFGDLGASKNQTLRENALLNWANGITEMAKRLDPQQQYNERVQALQQAVSAYESVVKEHSDFDRAKANLNHARYELKKMLQEPPPEQENSEDGEGEEGEQEQEQEQQSGDQEQESDDEEQDSSEDSSQDQDENEEDSESSSDPNQQSNPPQQQEEQNLDDRNIEAILESLEERDREEQKELRKARGLPQVRNGKWW